MEDNYIDAETTVLITYNVYEGVPRQAIILSMVFPKPHCKLDTIHVRGILKYQHTKKVQTGKPLYVVFICLSTSVKKLNIIKRLSGSWTVSNSYGDLPTYKKWAREAEEDNYYFATTEKEEADNCIGDIIKRWGMRGMRYNTVPCSSYSIGITRIYQSVFDDDTGHFLRYLIKENKVD